MSLFLFSTREADIVRYFDTISNMKIIFITGASGSGKTTILQDIEKSHSDKVAFYYFDSVGVPSKEEMNIKYGSGEKWQQQTTIKWLDKILAGTTKDLAILEGQMKLEYITNACTSRDFQDYQIILIDCDDSTREHRLSQRGQSELANRDMMNWAKYLRHEAKEVKARVIDTTAQTEQQSKLAILQLMH